MNKINRNYKELADEMSIFVLHGRKHVLRPFYRNAKEYPEPDYLGTGRALVAILKTNETLKSFKKNWILNKQKFNKI